VERHSRSFLLAKMRGCDTEAVLKGLTRRMRAPPAAVRKTLTYGQGREIARHQELARRLSIHIYFAAPNT
jgi:IS30 family transposase